MVPERSRMRQRAVHSPGQAHGVPWALLCSLLSLEVAEMVLAPGTGSCCLPPTLSGTLNTPNTLNFCDL